MNTVDYTHFMSIIIPDIPSILATAQAVSASLDPGNGFPAFGTQLRNAIITPATEETPEIIEAGTEQYRYYGCPMTEATLNAILYMQTHPADLKATIDTAFSERWSELITPTLAEIEAFCAAVELFPDTSLNIVMLERVLTYAPEEL